MTSRSWDRSPLSGTRRASSKPTEFSWTPLALVAVLGLVLGARRNLMCRAGLVVLAAMAWLYGSWDAYWLGHSFGMRGFVDVSFFLLLGLAEVLRRTDGVPLRWASRVLLMLPLLWTVHLIVCYRAQIQPHGEPLAVGPILTEWKRWGEQVRKDTGLDVLIK